MSLPSYQATTLPPVASLFAAFLGYNPIRTLIGPTLAHLPAARVAFLTGRAFFPHLIAAPFASGLGEAFTFAVVACLIVAAASWLWGARFHRSTAGVDTAPGDDEAAALPDHLGDGAAGHMLDGALTPSTHDVEVAPIAQQ